MKTKFFVIAMLFMAFCSCDKYDELNHIESHSEISVSEGSTECSFNDVTAGIHVKAERISDNTKVLISLYANSDIVDEVRVVNERQDIDKMVRLPYNEEFGLLAISLDTEYEYSITWGDDKQISEIHIYYRVALVDGKLTIHCNSGNS